jgi:hypothetical protein
VTAQVFRPNFPRRDKDELDGDNFITRVTITEGTRKPSGLKAPAASPDAGSVHRNTVGQYVPVDLNHKPYSTAHRPEIDVGQLKANQTQMLSTRQKRKNKKGSS